MRISFDSAKPFIIALGVVVSVSIGARLVMADEAPPAQVQDSADSIYQNQKRITELRKYVEEFELLKSDNAKLVGRMEAFGWSYDWSTKKPIKLEVPLAQ